MSLEKEVEEVARRIIDPRSSFVTDEVRKTWIKTALLEWYSKGRVSVFHEDQAGLAKASKEDLRK